MLFVILRPLLPYLAGVLILLGIYGWGDHRGASRVQKRMDSALQVIREQRQRVEGEWLAERGRQEAAALRAQDNRERTFASIKAKAHDLPPAIARIRVDPIAIGVLDAAIQAANAPGPAAESDPPAHPDPRNTTLGLLTAWGVEALSIHRECVDRVAGWESFYAGLRKAEP